MLRHPRCVLIVRSLIPALLLFSEIAMASMFGTLFAGRPPAALGVRDGKLAPCPNRPNCVSSAAGDARHSIAPIAFRGDPATAMAKMAAVVRAMPGLTIVTVKPDYLHAEFASSVFGFVDDVELALDPRTQTFAVRSAARLGYGDFGVNRKRIEGIRNAYSAVQG